MHCKISSLDSTLILFLIQKLSKKRFQFRPLVALQSNVKLFSQIILAVANLITRSFIKYNDFYSPKIEIHFLWIVPGNCCLGIQNQDMIWGAIDALHPLIVVVQDDLFFITSQQVCKLRIPIILEHL